MRSSRCGSNFLRVRVQKICVRNNKLSHNLISFVRRTSIFACGLVEIIPIEL